MEGIAIELKINTAADKAFKKFVEELNEWWPKAYTWSGDKLESIRIDARKNGLCTELGPHGFRCDWGRVTELQENKSIRLKWQIGPQREPLPDPELASDLKLEFIATGDYASTVKFEHLNFKNHGEGAEVYRKNMASERGWPYILQLYKNYCERSDQ